MSRSRTRIPGPLRSAARKAKRAGWQISRTGSGHLRWKPPAGPVIITASTPGGGNRSISNSCAQLRKAGLTEEKAS